MNDTVRMIEKQISVYKKTEVLVVGGGPAGFCAAVSAARTGAKVILMERYGYLGGMATGGYVLLIDCIDDGTGEIVIKGLVEEMLERLRKIGGLIEATEAERGSSDMKDVQKWRRWGSVGGEDKIVRWSPIVDPELMKCVCNDMVIDAGVDLLFHSWFSEAIVENGKVVGAVFESKSGRQAILADVVIDCTGDGDVYNSAGCSFDIGNLPLGLVFRVGNVDCDRAEAFLSEQGKTEKISAGLKAVKGINGGYSFGELPQGFYMRSSIDNVVWFNNTLRGSSIDVEDLSRVEIQIRQAMLRTVKYFQKEVPGFENSVIIDTAPQVGVRSSRLLNGKYKITRKELMASSVYDDCVVVVQPPYRGFEPSDSLKRIPYRCFLPNEVKGLLVAGRCISGDFGAIEMLRVIPTAMLMGQACGTAAAIAVKDKVDVDDVDIVKVQKALISQNMYL